MPLYTPKVSRYGNNSNLIYIRRHRYVSQYRNHVVCHVMTSHVCLGHTSFNTFLPYLKALVDATFDYPYHDRPKKATHMFYKRILQEALQALLDETLCNYACIPLYMHSQDESNEARPAKAHRGQLGRICVTTSITGSSWAE